MESERLFILSSAEPLGIESKLSFVPNSFGLKPVSKSD
jgi:hypothetical protein